MATSGSPALAEAALASAPESPAVRHGTQPSVTLGQLDPVQKCSANCFYFQEFQKRAKTCKMHKNLSVYQKNMNDKPKCSES
jgi:hypothetical protein